MPSDDLDCPWIIEKAPIEAVTIETIDPVYETGEPVAFVSAVKIGDVVLPETDYAIVYANNVAGGTASAVVVGRNNLEGVTIATYEILPAANKRELDKKLAEAAALEELVVEFGTYTDPMDVGDEPLVYVDEAALATLTTAETTGQAVKVDSQATSTEIASAVQALADAMAAVEASYIDRRDTEGLQEAIDEAKGMADSLVASEDGQTDAAGDRMAAGTEYVPSEELAALKTAVSEAEGTLEGLATDIAATQADIDAATEAMKDAVKAAKDATKVVERWERIYGKNGYDTMEAIVGTDGAFARENTDAVVIASRAGWEDPLAATALAGVYRAPLLLVGKASESLPAQTERVLKKLKPKKVYVVGGTDVVPKKTFDAIVKAAGSGSNNVVRIAGGTYIERANAIFHSTNGWQGNTAIISTHNSFRDTLSASPLAYSRKFPILFVGNKISNKEGGKLDSSTVSLLKSKGISRVIVIGGKLAVSDQVEKQLKGIEVVRWYGQDSLDTSAKVAQLAISEYGMNVEHVSVARADGNNYVDALAGAALAGKTDSVLVLANSTMPIGRGTKAFDAISAMVRGQVVHGHVYGGTAAISKEFYDYFRSFQ